MTNKLPFNVVDNPSINKKELTYTEYLLKFRKECEEAVLKEIHAKEYTVDNIARKILADIINQMTIDARTVLLKLMGFDNHWGSWEIDHCNGRAGESAIGKTLQETFKGMAKDFVETHKEEITTLTKAEYSEILKSLHSDFKSSMESSARNNIKELGSMHGKILIDSLTENIKEDSVLKTALQLMELTDPKQVAGVNYFI